jgi:hypothetical protein
MTGEEFARRGIPRPGREAGVDGRVVDVGMSQPVFDKRQIRAGVEQVRGVIRS